MSKVKVGVIGTGFIGPAHIEALRRLGYVDVLALADVDEKTAREKADLLCIEKAYGDYRDLLADDEIAVVHICTPNHLHYPMAKEALLAGKHVICEKPLAMNAKEAYELVELAKEKGLLNAVHYNMRYYPLVQQAKTMVEKGELGRILAINGSYQQDWLFFETDYNWRLDSKLSGETRAVADIGTHWFDMMEFITGLRIQKLCADFATFHPQRKKPLKPIETYTGKLLEASDYTEVPIDTEDYASVLLRYENGAHGSFTTNQVAAGRKNRCYFEIYGDKQAIWWDSESPNELWIGKRDGNNEVMIKDPSLMHPEAVAFAAFPGGHPEGFPDTSRQMFAEVYRHIRDGSTDKFPNFLDGARELDLCDAIFESAKSEKWVTL
ncbi:MAG: Gfo/Idh/MocA family oxidoreductase [Oscillospiraceae bacterium]|nr:Gfo/Idh/MocA family oxidoreductase [Oscillospiraceae bacterium]